MRTNDQNTIVRNVSALVLLIVSSWLATTTRAAVWFGDVKEPVEVTASQAEVLLRAAAGQQVDLAPLRDDASPRIVFLSVSDGKSAARVSIGTGRGLSEALLQARTRLSDFPAGQSWIKLDVVQNVTSLGPLPLREKMDWETGVEGLAFDARSGLALLPDLVAVGHVINDQGVIVPSRLSATWEKFNKLPPPVIGRESEVFRFDTVSFFYDGKAIVELFRGHRRFESISDEQLIESAKLAGAYLTRSVGKAGQFVYEFRPDGSPARDQYNMLRHAGTIYAMMELYEVTPDDKELLAAAQRAIAYMQTTIKPWKVNGEDVLVAVDESREIKLGGNALAMVALLQYTKATGDRQHVETLRKLARWFQLTQEPNGRFGVQKQTYPTGEVEAVESNYYPGQAILALCRLHAIDPDDSYIATADKAADYLINIRYGRFTDRELFHDHWMMYGLRELHAHRNNALHLSHTYRLARVIMASQLRTPLWPDWLGGYYRPPRGNPTATRTEGLCAAYPMIVARRDEEFAKQIRDATELALRFQLQLQFDPPSAMYFDDPRAAIGGFHDSLTDPDIRIDTVQHNISAILGVYRIRAEDRQP